MRSNALTAAERWLRDRRAELEAQLDRFENYLSTLKPDGDLQ